MPKLEHPLKLSATVSNEERKQWIGKFPRIGYLGRQSVTRCEGHSGPVTSKGRRPCKLRAQFKFKALPSSWAKDGSYCWTHLADQLNEPTGVEKKSVEKWVAKNPPDWQDRYDAWAKEQGLAE